MALVFVKDGDTAVKAVFIESGAVVNGDFLATSDGLTANEIETHLSKMTKTQIMTILENLQMKVNNKSIRKDALVALFKKDWGKIKSRASTRTLTTGSSSAMDAKEVVSDEEAKVEEASEESASSSDESVEQDTKVLPLSVEEEKQLKTLEEMNQQMAGIQLNPHEMWGLQKRKEAYNQYLASLDLDATTAIEFYAKDVGEDEDYIATILVPMLIGDDKVIRIHYNKRTSGEEFYDIIDKNFDMNATDYALTMWNMMSYLKKYDVIFTWLNTGGKMRLVPSVNGGVKSAKTKVKKDGVALKCGMLSKLVESIQKAKSVEKNELAKASQIVADGLKAMTKLENTAEQDAEKTFAFILEKVSDKVLGKDGATSELIQCILKTNKGDLRMETLVDALLPQVFQDLRNLKSEVDGAYESGSLTLELLLTRAFYNEGSSTWNWRRVKEMIFNEIGKRGNAISIQELSEAFDHMEL